MNSTNSIPLGRLIADIGRLQASRLDQMMDELGLYRGQAVLLIVLGEQDGLTHSEIAEALKISPAAATKVIKRLEELGYLQRRADPSDDRDLAGLSAGRRARRARPDPGCVQEGQSGHPERFYNMKNRPN